MDQEIRHKLQKFSSWRPWSLPELICGWVLIRCARRQRISQFYRRTLQLKSKIHKEYHLALFFELFGSSARLAYSHADDLESYGSQVLTQIRSLTEEQLRRLTDEFQLMFLPAVYSYDILVMEPSNRQRGKAIIRFASRFIGDKVLEALEITEKAGAQRLYKTFLGSKYTSSVADTILSAWIHGVFTEGGRLPLTAMQRSIKKRRKNNVWSSEVDTRR